MSDSEIEDCSVTPSKLLAACDRLLVVAADIRKMPKEQRDWFFSKEGHADCFMVARALKTILQDGEK